MKSIRDVVDSQLCVGCGACAYLEPDLYRIGDSLAFGRRPFLHDGISPASETGEALEVCPGLGLAHANDLSARRELDADLLDAWGPVIDVWEGYAADPAIRLAGSSGGAATALALYCLEQEGMGGVLHTAADPRIPYLNKTVFSSSRGDLLARAGSRYSPASPAEGLGVVEGAAKPSVFIGKPCDVAAAQKARGLRPALDGKLGLVIAFFCAGTPSTQGLIDLLRMNGIKEGSLTSLRFRGEGWPGLWTARFTDDAGVEQSRQMTYADSWGFLQKYRQWRCYACPDHTGEFADVAVGDPWYRPVEPGEPGKSLIVARTRRGLEVLRAAEAAGYLVLETSDKSLLPRSQPNILATRSMLWGRLLTLRIMGAVAPRFSGFHLFALWRDNLNLRQKVQSIAGTAKRVVRKGLWKKVSVQESRTSS